MQMSKIKNIIFDLGNVLIDLDIPATERQLHELLGSNANASFVNNEQPGFFEDYELGLISEVEFVKSIQARAKDPVKYTDVIRIWNALLIGIPAHRFEMLEKLRKSHRVFLLSNTNYTHLAWIHAYLLNTHGIGDFEDRFFEKAFYSHLMHLRKPNYAIYKSVLSAGEMLPDETLFIDDNLSNVLGAAECGIHIHHHQQGDISEVITELLR